MNIHHLLFINTDGEVKIIKPSKGANNPPHLSTDSVTGYTVLHHMEAIDDMPAFMETKLWNTETEAWETRATRPNEFARWENGAWAWNSDDLLNKIRVKRTAKLGECDWALVSDSPLTDAEQTEVRTYRTALRDLPSTLDMTTISSINDVTWPTKPACLG